MQAPISRVWTPKTVREPEMPGAPLLHLVFDTNTLWRTTGSEDIQNPKIRFFEANFQERRVVFPADALAQVRPSLGHPLEFAIRDSLA